MLQPLRLTLQPVRHSIERLSTHSLHCAVRHSNEKPAHHNWKKQTLLTATSESLKATKPHCSQKQIKILQSPHQTLLESASKTTYYFENSKRGETNHFTLPFTFFNLFKNVYVFILAVLGLPCCIAFLYSQQMKATL